MSIAAALAILLLLLRHRGVPLDRPTHRSLHSTPVPRVGGLAVIPAIAAGWAWVPQAIPTVVVVSAAALFAVSFLDDVRDLSVSIRLSAHLAAAACVAIFLVLPQAGWSAVAFATLAVAWVTNLYNFMDGSDGLAGGMTLFGFAGYAIAAAIGHDHGLAAACTCVCGASAAFLWFNFPPARVFLGDAGSIPLGFLAAAIGIDGWLRELWPVCFPLLLFSPFIVDASFTLLRRALQRERVWQAHRQHYYQRLVRYGWGHRKTALAEYTLMACCMVIGIAGLHQPLAAQALMLSGVVLVYCVLMALIDRAWTRRSQEI